MPQTLRSQLLQPVQLLIRDLHQLKMTGNQLAETINKQIAYYKLLSGQTKERAYLKCGEIWKFKYRDTVIQESFLLMLFHSAFHHGPSSSGRSLMQSIEDSHQPLQASPCSPPVLHENAAPDPPVSTADSGKDHDWLF